jgi:diguanylate cyclase (GGDEF)-like protein
VTARIGARSDQFNTGPIEFAAAENERLIALLRIIAIALLTIIPLVRVVLGGSDAALYRFSLGFNLTLLVLAVGIALALRRVSYRRWIGRATAVYDVTMVSALLMSYALLVGYQYGMLNRNTFPVYVIALTAAGLRLDRIACLLAGIAAVLGWAAVIAVSLRQPDAAALAPAAVDALLIDQTNRFMVLAVAVLVALAVVRVGRRLVELASLDGLTGTLNRPAFEVVLKRELLRARRYGTRLAVAYLDLDHLKRTNDRYGHARGDELLKLVAERVSAALRRSDVVARYGGDEFAVLLPQADATDAVRRLDAIRAAFAAAPLGVSAGNVSLTVTVGVACFPEDGTEELTLLDVADSRLLAGKRAGRDRVVGPER